MLSKILLTRFATFWLTLPDDVFVLNGVTLDLDAAEDVYNRLQTLLDTSEVNVIDYNVNNAAYLALQTLIK